MFLCDHCGESRPFSIEAYREDRATGVLCTCGARMRDESQPSPNTVLKVLGAIAIVVILLMLGWEMLNGVVPCLPMWACIESDR